MRSYELQSFFNRIKSNVLVPEQVSRRVLFLDLEDTVIDNWTSGNAVNTVRVRNIIKAVRPTEVRLFSYAVYNKSDVDTFNTIYRKWLEDLLGIKFEDEVFCVDDLFQMCKRDGVFYESIHDCMSLLGKAHGFQRFIEMSPEYKDCVITLVDDVVTNKTFLYHDRNMTINYIDVNKPACWNIK